MAGIAVAVAAVGAVLGTLGTAAASARPRYFAVSEQDQCVANRNINGFLHANHANVLRLILSPQDASTGAGTVCAQDAHAAGFKVYISFQFDNRLTARQVASYFKSVLPAYARYAWAIGVGNEQDLSGKDGYGQGTTTQLRAGGRTSGQNYRVVWNAVEPVLVKLAPRALRVYGEFSPWSFKANKQGFASGRPRGVQALASHCYHTKFAGLTHVPQQAAWAAHEHLPLWCSEMAPALPRPTTPSWAVADTWSSWRALVARIISRSPDLQMTSYYHDPGL